MRRVYGITCTGDRHKAFALCERWMDRQTHKLDGWFVVDDGEEPTLCTLGQTVIRRKRTPTRPGDADDAQMRRNIRAGLFRLSAYAKVDDVVVVIEDDEWYAPQHVATVWNMCHAHPVVGQRTAVYYHIPSGRFTNPRSVTTLSSYAFVAQWISRVRREAMHWKTPRLLDERLRRATPLKRFGGLSVVGMKGIVPVYFGGRQSKWHEGRGYDHLDENRMMLRTFVGDDWKAYEGWFDAA